LFGTYVYVKFHKILANFRNNPEAHPAGYTEEVTSAHTCNPRELILDNAKIFTKTSEKKFRANLCLYP